MDRRTFKFCLFSALAAAGLCSALVKADSITVMNASFEQPVVSGGFDESQPTDWDVLGDMNNASPVVGSSSIDHIGNYWQAAQGNQSLDMNGLSYGVIGQTLSGFTPGVKYAVSFDMAANRDGGPTTKYLQVDMFGQSSALASSQLPYAPTNNPVGADGSTATFDLGSAITDLQQVVSYNETLHPTADWHSDMEWADYTLTFTAASSTEYLQFTSRTLSSAGGYPVSPYGPALDNVSVVAVPLPATAGVGCSILSGFGVLAVLRKRFSRRPQIA